MPLIIDSPNDALADVSNGITAEVGQPKTETLRGSARNVRVSRYELSTLTTQLAIMIRAGVDLVSALTSLERQASSRGLKAVLASVRDDVLGGRSFSKALERYQKTFGSTYVATVAAGEVAGELAQVLTQLSKAVRGEMKLRSSLRALMIYPLTLVGAAGLVVLGLVVFILPKFADIFGQFGTELPKLTSVVLAVGDELNARSWLWGSVAGGAIIGLLVYWRSDAGKRVWDRLLVSAIIVRRVGRPLLIGRACRLMGLMLSSGVPLLETIRLTRNGVNSYTYARLFNKLEEEVLNGRGMSNILPKFGYVPSEAVEMLCTAEQTSTLAEVTTLLADHFEDQAESRLREVIAMLEPAVTIVMGLFVSGIVLSVLLPMFDLSTLTQQGIGGP